MCSCHFSVSNVIRFDLDKIVDFDVILNALMDRLFIMMILNRFAIYLKKLSVSS